MRIFLWVAGEERIEGFSFVNFSPRISAVDIVARVGGSRWRLRCDWMLAGGVGRAVLAAEEAVSEVIVAAEVAAVVEDVLADAVPASLPSSFSCFTSGGCGRTTSSSHGVMSITLMPTSKFEPAVAFAVFILRWPSGVDAKPDDPEVGGPGRQRRVISYRGNDSCVIYMKS